MIKHTISYGVGVLLVCGCGSSETSGTQQSDALTTFGSGCSTSSNSVAISTPITETQTIASTLEVECPGDLDTPIPGPGVSNTGSGALVNAGRTWPVNTANYDLLFSSNAESATQLILHDGEYRSRVRSVTNGTDTAIGVEWGIYNASVLIDMELVQIGQESLTGGSFEVEADTFVAATNRVSDIIVFTDKDGDSKPSAIDEVFEVLSGNVNVSGVAPDWTVTLDLTLEDGSTMTGNYTGSFYSVVSE